MLKRVILVVMTAALVIGSSCPPNNQGSNGNNALVPRSWSQVYSDKENSGFNAVHSTFALAPLKKWTTSVGELAFSSPIVGPDGVIYVGTVGGELVGVNPDGSLHLRRRLATSILSSPAVNNQTDEIFVLGQDPLDSGGFQSRLFRLGSSAELLAVSGPTPTASAAPKLWGNFAFLQAGSGLFVFDQTSLAPVGSVEGDQCFNIVCGGPGSPTSNTALNLLGCLTLGISDVLGLTQCFPGFQHGSVPGPILGASVAIVDSPNLVNDPKQPTVVVVGLQCASAFRFHPAGDAPVAGVNPLDPHFEILWSHVLVDVDCDFKTVRSTTPAAVLGGEVLIGDENGRVLSLDVTNGQVIWTHSVSEPVQTTPVAILRDIYIVTKNHLVILDSNGTELSRTPLVGIGQNAALSDDFVYVTTDQGVHTFALDPQQGFAFDSSIGSTRSAGASFPALGEDGTVYVSTPNGFLHSYSHGLIARVVNFPVVTWQTPADGATVLSSPGQSLVVSIAGANGAAFSGTVTFTSDVDGTLCSAVQAGATATCITTKPLSVGTNRLNALATDSDGGTSSATITVQVVNPPPPPVNTPPTVSISAPATNAVFAQDAPILFTATVSDPDQPSFPAAGVQWQSNIDGKIGTGFTFSRKLSLGTHTITATATDAAGASRTATVSILVVARPVVIIQQPTDGATLFSGTPLTFSATVTDPGEPAFPAAAIEWQSSIDGLLGTGATISAMLSTGKHTITCTATDTHGIKGRASVQVSTTPVLQ